MHWDVRAPDQVEHGDAIRCGGGEWRVTEHGSDADQVNLWVKCGEHQGNGVIRSRVAIDDQAVLAHEGSIALEPQGLLARLLILGIICGRLFIWQKKCSTLWIAQGCA